jgi:hypothetical protein
MIIANCQLPIADLSLADCFRCVTKNEGRHRSNRQLEIGNRQCFYSQRSATTTKPARTPEKFRIPLSIRSEATAAEN